MAERADSSARPAESEPLRLRRLLEPGRPATVAEILEGMGTRDVGAAGRPHLILNMVSTADGRATLGGRSGPISNRADRELFHGLRASVDAVMVGAGTVRAERYGRLIRERQSRRLRRERGLCGEPLACIVSGSLSLPADLPLLREPEARVVIVTSSQASLAGNAAKLDYVRAAREGQLDLPAAMRELSERLRVRTLLCEGGPHLNAQLLAAGLVDELFLSLSPKLAGGDPATGEGLRILAGEELDPPLELELVWVLEQDSHLFLRYRVKGARDPAA
ncbi:MAG: dihydrofolate reductase family protein [Solirubrobacteraceae bacterium]